MVKNALRSLIVCLIAMLFSGTASHAQGTRAPVPAPKKYTLMLAYFTATPKPLRPGQVRSKNPAILPEDGASFTLDISTPVRFRKQMESVAKDYDYSLSLAGSVVCESDAKAQTELRILPDKSDRERLQMTGLVWVSQIQPHIVKLALTSIGAFVTTPGVKDPVKVFSLDSTRSVVVGRTYVAGYQVTGKAKDSPTNLLAVCVVPTQQ